MDDGGGKAVVVVAPLAPLAPLATAELPTPGRPILVVLRVVVFLVVVLVSTLDDTNC